MQQAPIYLSSMPISSSQVRIKAPTSATASTSGSSSHSSTSAESDRRRNTIVDEAMHHLVQDLKEVDFDAEPEKATEALETFRHHLQAMRKLRSRRHSTASDNANHSRPYVDMNRCNC
ncbi:hypothetical protein THRCLA_21644 [Thraustotheca clavata]|uniref:Uncharacterized protein n=1 Tax=Thraustotheca clavata TaxID=74557 RepID=A0A1V9ZSP3_9STRA|nr:hypothetical protein THRCLA_21644 [Thraustotheca clavata]